MSSKVYVVLGALAIAAFAAWLTLVRTDPSATGEEAPASDSRAIARDGGSSSASGPILKGQGDGSTTDSPAVPRPSTGNPHVAPEAGGLRADGQGARPATAGAEAPATEAAAEFRIVVGRGEAARGLVRVRPRAGTAGAKAPATEHVIGPDGSLRVPLCGDVFVEVRVEGRQARGLRLDADREDEPVEVVFGTGAVFGTVRDPSGLPVANLGVRLVTHLESTAEGVRPIARGHVFEMSTSTDVDGSYRFEDLPVGDFVLVARRAADDPAADRNIRSVRISLGAGESQQVDFGKEDQEPLLTGVLRYGDGVAVSRLVHMFMTTVQGGGRLYVNTDAEGHYSQRMPAGTYEVELVIGLAHSAVLGMRIVPTSQRIVLEHHGTAQDILFPGTRIEGRVRGYKAPYPQQVRASLIEPEGEVPVSRISKEPAVLQRVSLKEDGTFQLDGLTPGLWRLSGSPRALRPVEVRVDAQRDVLSLDLELADE